MNQRDVNIVCHHSWELWKTCAVFISWRNRNNHYQLLKLIFATCRIGKIIHISFTISLLSQWWIHGFWSSSDCGYYSYGRLFVWLLQNVIEDTWPSPGTRYCKICQMLTWVGQKVSNHWLITCNTVPWMYARVFFEVSSLINGYFSHFEFHSGSCQSAKDLEFWSIAWYGLSTHAPPLIFQFVHMICNDWEHHITTLVKEVSCTAWRDWATEHPINLRRYLTFKAEPLQP